LKSVIAIISEEVRKVVEVVGDMIGCTGIDHPLGRSSGGIGRCGNIGLEWCTEVRRIYFIPKITGFGYMAEF
jgi:hypothetical protein